MVEGVGWHASRHGPHASQKFRMASTPGNIQQHPHQPLYDLASILHVVAGLSQTTCRRQIR